MTTPEALGGYCQVWKQSKIPFLLRSLVLTCYRLIDEENNIVETLDTPGELCLRGPTVMIGYLDNTKDTLSTIDPDGWLRTGDICYCDSQTGKWYIVDRKKV